MLPLRYESQIGRDAKSWLLKIPILSNLLCLSFAICPNYKCQSCLEVWLLMVLISKTSFALNIFIQVIKNILYISIPNSVLSNIILQTSFVNRKSTTKYVIQIRIWYFYIYWVSTKNLFKYNLCLFKKIEVDPIALVATLASFPRFKITSSFSFLSYFY